MSAHRSFTASALLAVLLVAPSALRAEEGHQHGDIVISSNREFDRAHGVSSGRGTKASPYVFSGLNLNSLRISDTSRAIKIVNSSISFLTLNYIGSQVEVVDNDIGDLRVNENVERTGAPTGGRFISNTFDQVSQLRHFDGRFAYNTVGRPLETPLDKALAPYMRAVNFDGFNGAMFDHNLIYGPVDAQLHGHHHSSRFGSGSHMHAGHHDMVDHTVRYHELRIFANRIYAPESSYALAYLDTIHSANDRTAASEENSALEKPHLHRTRVAISGNSLHGSGLLVNVFNAEDELHRGMPQGWLSITDNKITLQHATLPFFGSRNGIEVAQARHVSIRIGRNVIAGPGKSATGLSGDRWTYGGDGIALDVLDHATVMLDSNSVSGRWSGIRASNMPRSVTWTIRGLRTSGVEQPVAYDDSVANAPRK